MQKTGNELTYDYDFYALNGLLSFLLIFTAVLLVANMLCQRPKRASFISTDLCSRHFKADFVCQRPKRASFISTAGSCHYP